MHAGGRRLGQGLEDQKSGRRRDTLGLGTECQGRITVQTSQQPLHAPLWRNSDLATGW